MESVRVLSLHACARRGSIRRRTSNIFLYFVSIEFRRFVGGEMARFIETNVDLRRKYFAYTIIRRLRRRYYIARIQRTESYVSRQIYSLLFACPDRLMVDLNSTEFDAYNRFMRESVCPLRGWLSRFPRAAMPRSPILYVWCVRVCICMYVCLCVCACVCWCGWYEYHVLCPMCGSRGARCVIGMLSAAGSRVAHCYSLSDLLLLASSGLPARPLATRARSIPF